MRTLLLAVCLLGSYAAFGQSFAEWEEVLDEYCLEHFADCFGAEYGGIKAVSDVDFMTESHVVLRGDLLCSENGSNPMAEPFQADVRFFRDHITIKLRRHSMDDDPGSECERELQ